MLYEVITLGLLDHPDGQVRSVKPGQLRYAARLEERGGVAPRAEVIVGDDGVVEDAFISSTLWRGIEVIAKGRDPRNLPVFVITSYSIHYTKLYE